MCSRCQGTSSRYRYIPYLTYHKNKVVLCVCFFWIFFIYWWIPYFSTLPLLFPPGSSRLIFLSSLTCLVFVLFLVLAMGGLLTYKCEVPLSFPQLIPYLLSVDWAWCSPLLCCSLPYLSLFWGPMSPWWGRLTACWSSRSLSTSARLIFTFTCGPEKSQCFRPLRYARKCLGVVRRQLA